MIKEKGQKEKKVVDNILHKKLTLGCMDFIIKQGELKRST